jgi:hypothetical protein
MAERAFRHNASVRKNKQESGGLVSGGPFAGMRYPTDIAAQIDALPLKITGLYEKELHEPLVASANRHELFVDVGAADGYYAVGMAMLGLPVLCYEASRLARKLCLALANENGVRLDLRGACRWLPRLPNALVLIDVEGAEDTLLAGGAPRRLRGCTLIVETHDFLRPGVTNRLREGLRKTHRVETLTGSLHKFEERQQEPLWLVCQPAAR